MKSFLPVGGAVVLLLCIGDMAVGQSVQLPDRYAEVVLRVDGMI